MLGDVAQSQLLKWGELPEMEADAEVGEYSDVTVAIVVGDYAWAARDHILRDQTGGIETDAAS